MISEKRYTESQATTLLSRVMGATTSAKARRALAALLDAPLGDLRLPYLLVRDVADASDTDITRWIDHVQGNLICRAGYATGGLGSGVVLRNVALKITSPGTTIHVQCTLSQALEIQGLLLFRKAGHRLQRCEDPKCGRVFVKVGKRRACGPRCAKRYYMERFRAGDTGRDA